MSRNSRERSPGFRLNGRPRARASTSTESQDVARMNFFNVFLLDAEQWNQARAEAQALAIDRDIGWRDTQRQHGRRKGERASGRWQYSQRSPARRRTVSLSRAFI